MSITPTEHLKPLQPIIGRWRSSGTVLDPDGRVVDSLVGTDTYTWLPGGNWVVHVVDVMMGGDHTEALELIGGREEGSDGWQMHAFDTADQPGVMRLTVEEPDLLLLQGTTVSGAGCARRPVRAG